MTIEYHTITPEEHQRHHPYGVMMPLMPLRRHQKHQMMPLMPLMLSAEQLGAQSPMAQRGRRGSDYPPSGFTPLRRSLAAVAEPVQFSPTRKLTPMAKLNKLAAADEEALAIAQLAAAKRMRLRSKRVEVSDPWKPIQSQVADAEPVQVTLAPMAATEVVADVGAYRAGGDSSAGGQTEVISAIHG
jgi:hypothetical protein